MNYTFKRSGNEFQIYENRVVYTVPDVPTRVSTMVATCPTFAEARAWCRMAMDERKLAYEARRYA